MSLRDNGYGLVKDDFLSDANYEIYAERKKTLKEISKEKDPLLKQLHIDLEEEFNQLENQLLR